MSDIAEFVGDRFYRSQFQNGLSSYLIFQQDGVTYADPLFPGGTPYSAANLTGANNPIQQAINAVSSLGKSQILIKDGTYDFLTGQPQPVGYPKNLAGGVGLVLPSNITLRGESWKTILTTTSPVPGSPSANDYFGMIVNKDFTTGNKNIVLRDLSIVVPSPSETATGMQAWDDTVITYGMNNSLIDNVYTLNGGLILYPNSVYINTASVLSLGTNNNNRIVNCTSENQTINTGFFQGTDSWFVNNRITKTWDDAFIIASAGTGHKVIGNIIDGGVVVANKGAATALIYLQNDGAVGSGPSSGVLQDNLVAYNTCKNHVKNNGNQSGIYELAARNNTYRDNFCFNNVGNGIGLEQSDHSQILGGRYYLNQGRGIRVLQDLAGTLYSVIIDGATCYNNGTVASQQSGINIAANVGATLQDLIVTNCHTWDDQGAVTQLNGIQLTIDGTISNLLLQGNNVIRQTNPISIQGAGTLTGRIIDNIGYNPQGVAAITVTASPFTYTNNDRVSEYVTIDGGTITTVAKNAITLYSFGGAAARCGVWLEPSEAVTVTYTVAPTMNKDRK